MELPGRETSLTISFFSLTDGHRPTASTALNAYRRAVKSSFDVLMKLLRDISWVRFFWDTGYMQLSLDEYAGS